MWLAALLVACTDPNADPPAGWVECPLFAEGKDHPSAQCATLDVPLRHVDPDGATIELFVQRHLGSEDSARQVWMLAGGPGQSGAVWEGYVKDLAQEDPDTDWYLVDHRGTGRSTRLGCPVQEADGSPGGLDITAEEWADCLAEVQATWGADLAAFSSDEAARDLELAIATFEGDQQVFLYGASYGTTLAHRFLQQFPDRVDGVVLDSIAVDVDHRAYDAEFDAVGEEFLRLCAADDRCAEAMGPDPYAEALGVLSRVADGHCAEAIDVDLLRSGAGAFLADASLRGFAPSLFYRAARCDEGDAKELERLVGLFVDRAPHYTERLESAVLFANIELSEQWPEPWPTLEEVQAVEDGAVFSFGIGSSQRPLLDVWPRYLPEHDGDARAETSTPLLMLQGGLDPLTPLHRATPLADVWDGPGQHLVVFPEGTHVLLGSTPGKGGDCATQLLFGFLDDPDAAPDDACVATVDPVRFDGQPLVSQVLFTDCGRWGDGCATGPGRPGWAVVLLAAVVARRRRAR